MTDKLRSTFPIAVTVGEGQQPTAVTINAISTQAKNGLGIVEKAVGDIWGQSGDALLATYPTQVANIARVLGRQYLGNAHFPKPDLDGGDVLVITQDIASQVGQPELVLHFKPAAGDGTLVTSLAAGTANYTSPVARTSVDSDIEYFVDTSNAKIFLGSPWPADAPTTISYGVNQADLPSDNAGTGGFNVIPDPRTSTSDWKGLKFYKVSANKYLLFLPPRRPTSLAGEGNLPDVSGNEATDEITLKYYFPSKAAFEALGSGVRTSMSKMHEYRYMLPEEIRGRLLDSSATGEQLPDNFLYLWDNDTNSIVQGVTFRVPEAGPTVYGGTVTPRARWVIQVTGANLDALLDSYDVADISLDDPDDYVSRFSLVTVGQSLAKSVDGLKTEALSHSHAAGQGSRILHSSLSVLHPDGSTNTSLFHLGGSSVLPKLGTTFFNGDDHGLYLARTGSGIGNTRDRYNNGMLGDLLMLSTGSTSNYQNITSDSRKVRFGSVSGPSIGYTTSGVAALDLSATGTDHVSIGKAAAGSHLFLANNKIRWGATTHELIRSTDEFQFLKSSATTNTVVRAGVLKADDGEVGLDNGAAGAGTRIRKLSDGVVSVNTTAGGLGAVWLDTLVLADSLIDSGNITWTASDTFLFSAPIEVTGDVIASNNLVTGNNTVVFGTSTNNDTLVYNNGSSTYEFYANGSIGAATIRVENIRTDQILKSDGSAYTRRHVVNTSAFFIKETQNNDNYAYTGRLDYANASAWTTTFAVFQIDPASLTGVTKVYIEGTRTVITDVDVELQSHAGTSLWNYNVASANGNFTVNETLAISPNAGEPLFLVVQFGNPNGTDNDDIKIKYAYIECTYSTLQNSLGLS